MMDTPSEAIIKRSNPTVTVMDGERNIVIRKLGPRERMRFFEILGPENVQNPAYFGYAMLAACVVEIDGDPVAPATSRRVLEAMVARLDESGLSAVGKAVDENFINKDDADTKAILKNE
jgi:hypothetical protein